MTMLDIDQPIHDQIDELRTATDTTVPPDVRAYYDGEHPPVATVDQQMALGDRAIRPYVENMLQRCTDALASRLLFDRYVCDTDDDVQEALDVFAAMNHMTRVMVTTTTRVIVDGNSALSLSWHIDGSRVVVHQEPWWDGTEGMYVETGSDGIEQWAVKEWTPLGGSKRRTVYLPDQIQRFVQNGSGWQPLADDHIQPWTKRSGKPLGVPVIHFGAGSTDGSMYGDSRIAPLLGLQDALNGTLFDIVAAQAMNAFGIYTATGVSSDTALGVGPGRLWKTEAADASFGVLNGSSMTEIMGGYKAIRSAIASQFPVAEHIVSGGDWPSGLALQKVEGPMIGAVKRLGDTMAPAWVRVAHRAVEMMNAYGDATLDEDALVQVRYEPAEQMDEGTTTEIDMAKVNVYRELAALPRALMLKTGLVDEDEADAIIAERDSLVIADAGF